MLPGNIVIFFGAAIAFPIPGSERFAVAGNAKLLIVGASGGTGARALRGLLDVGYAPSQLVVTTRDPSKPTLKPLAALGIELRAADLDDPTTLVGVGNGCTGCYVHSTAGDTKQLDTGEVSRAQHLAEALAGGTVKQLAYNSAAAEADHGVKRIDQKHAVEDVFSSGEFALPATHLRANLFMEELWKSYTRPPILKGTYPFSLPSDRPVYLTSVRDMGRLAGVSLSGSVPPPSGRRINVASEVTNPAMMAEAFANAQGTPCVHKRARFLRLIARLFLPDLFEVIQFYRTSTETTDVAALEEQFPGLLTSFEQFLDETEWGNLNAVYEDLATIYVDP